MFNYVKKETNKTRTTNDMVAYKSTKSALLDLFFEIGNLKKIDDDILNKCAEAYTESKQDLMSIMLWARDCRQGAGRRNAPRQLLRKWFESGNLSKRAAILTLERLVEVGRWDDVWHIALETEYEGCMAELIFQALDNKDGLCAKWLPRKGPVAAKIRKLLNLSPKQYRKTIVGLTNVVETKICEGKFHEINYNHVPAMAMSRYMRLFNDKDAWRFGEWKEALKAGKVKAKVKVLYPYEIIRNLWTDEEVAEAQWKEKAKEVQAQNTSFLPVIDVSGSMLSPSGAGVPCMDVAVSIGMLLSECANNKFHHKFVTFSEKPTLVDFDRGNTLRDKVSIVRGSNWGFNTDLEAVFDLVLQAAVHYNFKPTQLPKYLLIISDMQFDQATNSEDTALSMIKRKYDLAGYKMPKVVFWNVAYGYGNTPAVQNENNVIMISGFATNLLDAIIKSPESVNPMMFLQEILDNPRYRIDGM
jgi:hypothetical protein